MQSQSVGTTLRKIEMKACFRAITTLLPTSYFGLDSISTELKFNPFLSQTREEQDDVVSKDPCAKLAVSLPRPLLQDRPRSCQCSLPNLKYLWPGTLCIFSAGEPAPASPNRVFQTGRPEYFLPSDKSDAKAFSISISLALSTDRQTDCRLSRYINA